MKNKKYIVIVFLILFVVLVLFVVNKKEVKKDSVPHQVHKKANQLFKDKKYQKAIGMYEKVIQEYPEYENISEIYFNLSRVYSEKGQLLKSRELLNTIINNYTGSEIIDEVQKELEKLNMKILFSPIKTPNSIIYEVKKGDSLQKIAKQYGTTVDLIKKSNDLDSDVIIPGMKLKVVISDFKILVIKSQHALSLKLDDKILKTYKISVGKGNYDATPTGEFEIVNKLKDPTWFRPGEVIPPDDPKNILGSRWLGLSKKGYGIHGTTEPETIGQSVTAGCVRMFDQDVKELFSIVPVGTKVEIVE